LIELLTVIAIVGILAALLAPSLSHFRKGDVVVATTRQMLDDVGRARQLAIANRTTVYMVFVHTNFWKDPFSPTFPGGTQWGQYFPPTAAPWSSGITTQLYAMQLTGYNFASRHSIGSQPGEVNWRYLSAWRALPEGAFIAPLKFSAPRFPATPFYITNYQTPQVNFPIYRFQTTNIPFPIAELATNIALSANQRYVTMPYIAFNYLGQLCDGTGQPLGRDEYIPLGFGSILYARDQTTKMPVQGLPVLTESPAGNSTNIAYNVIHVDALTGRARLEHADLK
jgi:type II secretory pathway pseudopilin PulG